MRGRYDRANLPTTFPAWRIISHNKTVNHTLLRVMPTKQVRTEGEFTLVAASDVTHVWLTRAYLENDHPVLDSLQIPDERIQTIINMLEERQRVLDESGRARLLPATAHTDVRHREALEGGV